MFTLFSRFSRIRSVLHSHSDNPYLRGRAAQIAGGALVADGLVGLENPLDGKKTRSGIVGQVMLVGFAVLWIFLIGLMTESTQPYENGLTAEGTVVGVSHDSGRPGKSSRSCGAMVQYTVGGVEYSTQTEYSSSSLCNETGRTVPVSYLADAPQQGRPIFDDAARMFTIFGWIGWTILLFAVIGVAVRLAELVVGGWLLLWGRKQVASAAPSDTTGLMEELQAAWGSSAAPTPEAPSQRLGGLQAFQAVQTVLAQKAVQPNLGPVMPSGPPAGWYTDPQGGPQQRWWDGVQWTEHLQDRPEPSNR